MKIVLFDETSEIRLPIAAEIWFIIVEGWFQFFLTYRGSWLGFLYNWYVSCVK